MTQTASDSEASCVNLLRKLKILSMNKFIILIPFLLIGCATPDQGSFGEDAPLAEMISTQLHPKKGGTIRLQNNSKAACDAASTIMKKVCGKQFAMISQVDKVTGVTGSKSVSDGMFSISENVTATTPVVKFECVDKTIHNLKSAE